MIDVLNLCKIYQLGNVEVPALMDATFSFDRGEFVAIMGPSGSGKSTLMNLLGCLDLPTSGTYRLDGNDIQDMKPDQLAEVRNRRIGFVFQNFNLLPKRQLSRERVFQRRQRSRARDQIVRAASAARRSDGDRRRLQRR